VDFSSTELFAEVLVAGILLTLAVSPILILFSPTARGRDGLVPCWGEWKPWIMVVVALVYALGIAGNRLIDELYKSGNKLVDELHKCRIELKTQGSADFAEREELEVRDHSEIARDWVERHKSYHKVLRAASFSSLLFLLSMIVYRMSGPERPRYFARHYVAAMVLCLLFSVALIKESSHYRKNLALYSALINKKATESNQSKQNCASTPP
jgi:hypothetical protein